MRVSNINKKLLIYSFLFAIFILSLNRSLAKEPIKTQTKLLTAKKTIKHFTNRSPKHHLHKRPVLRKTYVGIYINGTSVNTFYPITINSKNQPFLNIKKIVTKWLEMHVKCKNKGAECYFKTPNQRNISYINFYQHYCVKDNKKSLLSPNMLIKHKGQWWLRYDALSNCIPVKAQFDLERYAIYLSTHYKLASTLAANRRIELQTEQRQENERAEEKKLPIMEPKKKFNIQGRYRLNWNKVGQDDQRAVGELATNIDIFKGSLFASGSINADTKHLEHSPIYWNYTLQKPGYFHQLQIGNTFYNGSILLPIFTLKNAVNFELLEHIDVSKGFVYQSHTMPNTEIDVRRNGALVKILTTKKDGGFIINLPNVLPGDIITIRYYFQNGNQTTKTIEVSPDDAGLLKRHQWDTNFQVGQLDQSTQLSKNEVLSHLNVRYGINKNMTVGIQAMRFPTNNGVYAGGIDIDIQPLNYVNIFTETLTYKNDTDFASQANFTGVPNHKVQFQVQDVHDDSPLALMTKPIIYSTLPFTNLLPDAIRFFSAKDSVNLKSWQLTGEYKATNTGHLAGMEAIGAINRIVSLVLTGGIAAPKDSSDSWFSQTTAAFYINTKNLISISRNWIKNNSRTFLNYRYQSLASTGWNITIGLEQPDNGKFMFNANFNWNITKNVSAALFADEHSAYFQLAFQGIVAMQPGPSEYDQFDTGTVAGTLLAPPMHKGDKPAPVTDAIIQVGSLQTHTDKNGKYLITGITTDTPVKFTIAAKSLDASLIADKKIVMMRFRHGTFIKYNPKLDWTSGLDGIVMHRGGIPPKTNIEIFRHKGDKPIETAPVEDNGFFILDKLKPGHYFIKVLQAKHEKPILVTIKEHARWTANVKVKW